MAAIVVGGILDIISIGLTAASIGQTAIDGLGNSESDGNYRYRMRIGQSVEVGDQDGWAPEVKYFDAAYDEIARSSYETHWVNDGALHSEQFGDDTRQIYEADLIAGDNAICAAWFDFWDADATAPVLVLGGNILRCGGYWSPTRTFLRDEDGAAQPELDCVWLNRGYNGCNVYGNEDSIYGFALPGYYPYWIGISAGQGNPDEVCDHVRVFNSYACKRDEEDQGGDLQGDAPIYDDPLWTSLAKEVITSGRDIARVYCEHDRSRGRSILSLQERLFCDMRTRTLRPLCEDLASPGCYEHRDVSRRVATGSGNRDTELVASDTIIDAEHDVAKRAAMLPYSLDVVTTHCLPSGGLNDSTVKQTIQDLWVPKKLSPIEDGLHIVTANGTAFIMPYCPE